MPEHRDLVGSQLHEPKGADAASVNQVYVSDGSGGGAWKSVYNAGWENYEDVNTKTTPITLVTAGTEYTLTNDGAGAQTNIAYKIPGATNIWNSSTNQFDFTSLRVGDWVSMRVDMEPTTSGANRELTLRINFAIGGANPFTLPIDKGAVKSAGTGQITRYIAAYMGSLDVINNPAELTLESDGAGDSVVINGWSVKTEPLNPVYI